MRLAMAVLTAFAAALAFSTGVLAQADAARAARPPADEPIDHGFWTFPARSLGWWALDARALGGRADPAEFVRAAARAFAADGDAAPRLVAALLATGARSGVAHRVCLLHLGGGLDAAGAWRIEEIGAALEIRAPGASHAQLAAAVEELLGPGRTEPLPLRGGGQATAYWREGWPGWRRVEWGSLGDRFVLTVGAGSLLRWAGGPLGDSGEASHRDAIAAEADGDPVFEWYADLDALREASPARFSQGPAGRSLAPLGLSNARTVMLRAHRAADRPAFLGASMSWSARSWPPGSVRAAEVARGEWPVWAGEPGGDFATLAGVSPFRALGMAVGLYRASLGPMALVEFDRAGRAWSARHGKALERLLQSLEGPVLIESGESLRARAPLRRGAARDQARADLALVLESLPGVGAEDNGWDVPGIEGVCPRVLVRVGGGGEVVWIEAVAAGF